MADTEQRIINTQLNGKIELLAQEMKDFKDEMKDFKNEMRAYRAETRADIAEIRQSITAMGNHARNITIAAIIGVGAMIITILIK